VELEALQAALPDIEAKGASIAVISPQLEKYSKQVVKKHGLSFHVLCDKENRVASQFGLVFRLTDDLKALYTQFGIDLERFNGNGSWTLPIPARFIIDRQGIIISAEAHPDYTKRPEPADIVGILESGG
jgi:peroxiredoxin